MFYRFYDLEQLPFNEQVTPDKMLVDNRFNQGLQRLDYFVASGMGALVTGTTGLGKTCMMQLFMRQHLADSSFFTAYLHLTQMNGASFLRSLVTAMGETPKLGKDRLFNQILRKVKTIDRITVLIIDEAHLLTQDTLVDLRLLMSAGHEPERKLKILLCGQEALTKTLAQASLADLLNRIIVRYHLRPLSVDETACYIDHRLKCVGGKPGIFDEEAKEKIHAYAGGITRVVNNLASLCIMQGAAKEQKRINQQLVTTVAQELRLL